MENFDFYKNVKQNGRENDPNPGVRANRRIELLRLQTKKRLHPFPKQSFSSHLEADRLENAPYLESQKKRRCRLTQISCLAKGSKSNISTTVRCGVFLQGEKTKHSKKQDKVLSLTTSKTPTTPEKRDPAWSLSQSFVNLIMVDGKKSKAERIFSQTLKRLAEYLQGDVERKSHKKKEIHLLDKGETPSLLIISDKVEKRNVYHLLQKAINNVKPTLQVRKVRIARSVYQVPFIMKRKRQEKNAVRWIIESAKKKSRHSGITFSEGLASSVLDAFTAQGQAREKRDQLHRTAEANRAYLRYRWW